MAQGFVCWFKMDGDAAWRQVGGGKTALEASDKARLAIPVASKKGQLVVLPDGQSPDDPTGGGGDPLQNLKDDMSARKDAAMRYQRRTEPQRFARR